MPPVVHAPRSDFSGRLDDGCAMPASRPDRERVAPASSATTTSPDRLLYSRSDRARSARRRSATTLKRLEQEGVLKPVR